MGKTFLSQKSNAFRQVVLVEFPRKNAWTMAFVTSDTPEVVSKNLQNDENKVEILLYYI